MRDFDLARIFNDVRFDGDEWRTTASPEAVYRRREIPNRIRHFPRQRR